MLAVLIISFFLSLTQVNEKELTVIFNSENTKLARFELALVKDLVMEYSKQNKIKYKMRYKGIKHFKAGFELLPESEKDATMVINGISITDERKKTYDFSEPYMINKYSLMSRKDFFLKENDERTFKVAYQAGSIYESMMNKIKKIFPCEGIAYPNTSECVKKLNEREVDMIFADFVDSWIFDVKLIRHIDEKKIDRYGIMYQKGSILKTELDKVFASYKKTKKYSKLLDKHFGNHKPLFFN